HKGTMVVGVVFDPEREELFSAVKGEGARLNGKRIRVSDETRLNRSMLATGFAYDIATARKNNIGYFSRVVKKAQAVRRAGSAALDLCWMAAGRFDGFWELRLAPWDAAAGALMVTEAGGKVTCIDGRRYSVYGNDILATNGRIHRSLRTALTGK
ncbi:MAG: inositol monophosphatase, partial [bacterium]|nr:inositol monophosphatase [bacterium]